MQLNPVVVILTHPADLHADAVQAHLDTAGVEVRRLDTAELGTAAAPVTAHLRGGRFAGSLAGCDLTAIVGVWHRRPSTFPTGNEVDVAELRAGLGGVLATLPYLNHPADMAAAAFKPHQLALAARCGLAVPDTMITTQRPAAVAFAEQLRDQVVVKPMSRARFRLVDAHDRAGWDRSVHLTQRQIDTTRHIRLTVVDAAMYAARIESRHLDWRHDADACSYQVVDIPAKVADQVRQLLHALRLRFAALDFAVDTDGRWWFLEVNPNGQWLWIEHATGLPIAAGIATALHQPPHVNGRRPGTARGRDRTWKEDRR